LGVRVLPGAPYVDYEIELDFHFFWFALLLTLRTQGEVTNSIPKELNRSKEVVFAVVMSARAELDKELQTDPDKLNPLELEKTKLTIINQSKQLSSRASDFLENSRRMISFKSHNSKCSARY
jgi:hypothetical protein